MLDAGAGPGRVGGRWSGRPGATSDRRERRRPGATEAGRVAENAGMSADGRPIAVLLPGAGSSAGFVRRAFAGPLAAGGYELLAHEPLPGAQVVRAAAEALNAAARAYGPRLRLVGGVSL